jgi:AcrR family transcriptional regulator
MSKVTRNKIVQKCFEAIAEHGFCTLRTDKEIQRLKITKGAFYHYFPGKMELGYMGRSTSSITA